MMMMKKKQSVVAIYKGAKDVDFQASYILKRHVEKLQLSMKIVVPLTLSVPGFWMIFTTFGN